MKILQLRYQQQLQASQDLLNAPSPSRVSSNTVHETDGVGEDSREGTGEGGGGEEEGDAELVEVARVPDEKVEHDACGRMLEKVATSESSAGRTWEESGLGDSEEKAADDQLGVGLWAGIVSEAGKEADKSSSP